LEPTLTKKGKVSVINTTVLVQIACGVRMIVIATDRPGKNWHFPDVITNASDSSPLGTRPIGEEVQRKPIW
jgi:hypothetical protein